MTNVRDSDRSYPRIRFNGYSDAWQKRELKEISEKVTQKNIENNFTEVFTNSAEYGIISQRDFFDKDIANVKNLKTYYVVQPDNFVYNPRISNSAPVGPIKRNKLVRTGVMSPLYYIFIIHDIDANFLEYFFSNTAWHHFMELNGDTGARSDRFAIKDSIFCKMPVIQPSKLEQTQIGTLFQSLDNLITVNQRKVEKYQTLKKALLQRMFVSGGSDIPQIRFNGYSEAWQKRKLGSFTETYSGGTPSAGNSKYYGGDIPFIRSAEINLDKTKLYLTEAGLNNSSAKLVTVGDILYAMYGATSGEVGVSRINGAINQAILAIKPTQNDDPQFIMQWLRNQKEHIVNIYLQGGQGNLSGTIVKKLEIETPVKNSEELKIGTIFQKFDNLITVNQRKVETYKELKKALLQQMFV
ncbi:restriction endonuclease subunit S [Convivina intestini]|uniref:restriction endonuclease subunit S n=1 Tax=Convivina intestini TaxID=1505726 RepID=UPI00200CF63E|nr:restriction endonuclease subunit S [Convivina intestini]CAH1855255.1 hypothetical protein R078131_01163 [Convivina intestini]